MATHSSRQQKKLQKKRAKEKAEKKDRMRQRNQSLSDRLMALRNRPFLHVRCDGDFQEYGVTTVLVSRQAEIGQVAFAIFLVDLYCLGVKDAFANVVFASEYAESIVGKFGDPTSIRSMTPAAARKMIEGAVAFARMGGIAPHPDYAKAMAIFGDVQAEDSDETFVYGSGGKHCFITGPGESPERVREVYALLENNLGPEGFTYLIGQPAGDHSFDD